jgi:hypothetical protein
MDATAGTRMRGSDVWKGALAFGALGPPLGLLVMFLPSMVRGLPAGDALALLHAAGWVLMLLPMAYVFALLPVAACGAVAGLVRTLRPRWLAVLCTALAGGVASAAPGAVIGDIEAAATLSATGACSALLLALLFTHTAHDRDALPEAAH